MSAERTVDMTKRGYARVSTSEQNLDLQLDALKEYGCRTEDIHIDKCSSVKDDRPGLSNVFSVLAEGDILAVWKLDRLGRSLVHLVHTVDELRVRGVSFVSLTENILDTTSPSGELIFSIFSALTQFERRLIHERTEAGLRAARERGRIGGRPRLRPDNSGVKQARALYYSGQYSVNEVARVMSVSRATVYRYLKLPCE